MFVFDCDYPFLPFSVFYGKLRYIEGQFSQTQESTIGAFYLAKNVALKDGRVVKMQLWDTAGQE